MAQPLALRSGETYNVTYVEAIASTSWQEQEGKGGIREGHKDLGGEGISG